LPFRICGRVGAVANRVQIALQDDRETNIGDSQKAIVATGPGPFALFRP